jgi:hypothetical protein
MRVKDLGLESSGLFRSGWQAAGHLKNGGVVGSGAGFGLLQGEALDTAESRGS